MGAAIHTVQCLVAERPVLLAWFRSACRSSHSWSLLPGQNCALDSEVLLDGIGDVAFTPDDLKGFDWREHGLGSGGTLNWGELIGGFLLLGALHSEAREVLSPAFCDPRLGLLAFEAAPVRLVRIPVDTKLRRVKLLIGAHPRCKLKLFPLSLL
jgi:hypothetical protein